MEERKDSFKVYLCVLLDIGLLYNALGVLTTKVKKRLMNKANMLKKMMLQIYIENIIKNGALIAHNIHYSFEYTNFSNLITID